MPTLLAIDDDRAVLHLIEQTFNDSAIKVLTARDVPDGLALLNRHPDVLLLDIMLPEISGLEGVRKIQALDPKLPVIFITGQGTSDTAIEAMKLGAYDYLLKPLDLTLLRECVLRALEIRRLMHAPVKLPAAESPLELDDSIVGRSPPMQEVFKAIGRVAPQNVTVLVLGESGTGKEVAARAIYHHSKRANEKFLAVNCAAIPEALLESELFGHEKGSFTGAEQRRIGKFEQCCGGTIFLDEVGDMTPLVQSKVLRLLQEQRFERVGGTETIQTDVRIVAATNRDLKRMVADNLFREDLYYRLNGYTIQLPPLRERGDDVLLLVEKCLRRYSREMGREIHGFSQEAVDILRRHTWPGNVRELEAVLRQTVLQTSGAVVLPEFLPEMLRKPRATAPTEGTAGNRADELAAFVEGRLETSENLYAETLEVMERCLLARVLKHAAGNQSRAARILGITRTSLRNKLRALHFTLGASVTLEDETDEKPEPASAAR